jgi:Flp pilus assembly pilin Flp
MRRPPTRSAILACSRGGGLIEYVLLIGAVALIVIGGLKLFGTTLKTTVSGQADAVEDLEEARPGDGTDKAPEGPNPGNTNGTTKSVATADEAKGAPRPAGRGDVAEEDVTATDKMGVTAKADTTVAINDNSAVISNAARSDDDLGNFDFGWLLAGAGALVVVAVLFKGKRQAKAEAGDDKK